MTIKLDESILGIWFLSLDNSDLLFSLNDEEDKYKVQYRFRYYEDDKTHDSDDRKSWYEGVIYKKDMTLAEAIEATEKTFTTFSRLTANEPTSLIKGDMTYEEFMEEFKKLPFVHTESHPVH